MQTRRIYISGQHVPTSAAKIKLRAMPHCGVMPAGTCYRGSGGLYLLADGVLYLSFAKHPTSRTGMCYMDSSSVACGIIHALHKLGVVPHAEWVAYTKWYEDVIVAKDRARDVQCLRENAKELGYTVHKAPKTKAKPKAKKRG